MNMRLAKYDAINQTPARLDSIEDTWAYFFRVRLPSRCRFYNSPQRSASAVSPHMEHPSPNKPCTFVKLIVARFRW